MITPTNKKHWGKLSLISYQHRYEYPPRWMQLDQSRGKIEGWRVYSHVPAPHHPHHRSLDESTMYRAVKYRHFRNDSLSISGASSVLLYAVHLHSYRDTGYMRTYDRTCDRICCKIRILHIVPHIIAFSKLQTRKLRRIDLCENSYIFTHRSPHMHTIAFFQWVTDC